MLQMKEFDLKGICKVRMYAVAWPQYIWRSTYVCVVYICTYSLVCITCGENVVQINSMTTALSQIFV